MSKSGKYIAFCLISAPALAAAELCYSHDISVIRRVVIMKLMSPYAVGLFKIGIIPIGIDRHISKS